MLIASSTPVALGMIAPPGEYGADIAVAEGQPLGLPLGYGGPYVGLFACRMDLIRKMPGRVVGQTTDVEDRRAFVLTLQAREQHIRRERATSNICTNSGLMALAAATYLATMGESGLREVAELCYHKSHYAAERLGTIAGLEVNPQAPTKPFFKEFVVSLPRPVSEVNRILLDDFNIIGGYDLGHSFPALRWHMLLAVTEMKTKAAIDRLVDGLAQATG